MIQKTKNKKILIRIYIVILFAILQLSCLHTVFAVSISSEEIITLTNNSRTTLGLPSLAISDKLSEAAEKKAKDMFANQYFEHNSPQGLTPWDFIKSTGYEYKYAGENLAIDFITAGGVHNALMNSSSHRENILNSNYSQIGVAVIEDVFEGSPSIIVVEEFGAPSAREKVIKVMSLQKTEELLTEKVSEINQSIVENDLEKISLSHSSEEQEEHAQNKKINENIFPESILQINKKEKPICDIFSCEISDSGLILNAHNSIKLEQINKQNFQLFQPYFYDNILIILVLSYFSIITRLAFVKEF